MRKRFTGDSFSLGAQSVQITAQNQLWLDAAPTTGLLSNGLIHGSGTLALNVNVSLLSDGPSSISSGSAIENHGVMSAAKLLIKATINGAYNSSTMGLANHGIMSNVRRASVVDNVDGVGIFNSGVISGFSSLGLTSSISGKSSGLNRSGTGILNLGTINTGGLLKGSGVDGISNAGLIDFYSSAEGVNRVVGVGGNIGINNTGTIRGSRFSEVLSGSGGAAVVGSDQGIYNTGQINLEDGDDRMIARGGGGRLVAIPKPPFAFSPDLINTGTISMGEGADRIDVSENGISGALGQVGRVDMGGGNDLFLGFGDDQIISGGAGVDTLRLPAGTYAFTPSAFPSAGAMEVSAVGVSLIITDFERIGGLGASSTIPFPAAAGTLTFALA